MYFAWHPHREILTKREMRERSESAMSRNAHEIVRGIAKFGRSCVWLSAVERLLIVEGIDNQCNRRCAAEAR